MAGHVVILAGGKGTRLKKHLGDLPKPMVPIAKKPLLEHQIELAKHYEFSQITLLVGYGAEKIRAYFENGATWNVEIHYMVEPVPQGTAGAVLKALDRLPDRFLIMYGDTMLNVDLRRFYNAHIYYGADATLFLHPNDHPQDSDLVDVDEQNRVIAFYPYPHDSERYFPNLVNAALYVIEKAALEAYKDLTGVLDFGKHLLPRMLSDGKTLYGYRSPEYIKDVGSPERLYKVAADFHSGRIQQDSFVHSAPAVFLDRDGTLNVEKNRIHSTGDLELIPGVTQAIRRLNHSFYRTIIVTNQPIVARGDCSESELKEIHNKLETLLGREGAYVDAIYYCPHHPDRGFPGEREELKFACSCRKPAPGLVDMATKELNLDREHSWLVGDSTVDILTAQNAGLKSILVRTGHAGQDNQYPIKADFEFFDLNSSVTFILDTFPAMVRQAAKIVKDIKPGDRIVVGGLARSGKSTWASVLRYALKDLGLNAVVVCLDCWLKSMEDRGSSGVMTRYDVKSIKTFLNEVDNAAKTATFVLPHYDRISRVQRPVGQTIAIKKSDIIILDGVIALMADELVRRATLKVFIEGNEDRRKEIFWADYQARGFVEEEIETIYRQRQIDEMPQVLNSRHYADVVLQGVAQ